MGVRSRLQTLLFQDISRALCHRAVDLCCVLVTVPCTSCLHPDVYLSVCLSVLNSPRSHIREHWIPRLNEILLCSMCMQTEQCVEQWELGGCGEQLRCRVQGAGCRVHHTSAS